MAKFKPKPIKKWDSEGELYIFVGGRAKVPGMWWQVERMDILGTKFRMSEEAHITLKEFKEMR